MSDLLYKEGHALLIGIQYKGTNIRSLNTTTNDVKALSALLQDKQKAAYPPNQVTTLLEQEATTQNILDALDDLAQKTKEKEDSTVVIQYSGHGGVLEDTTFFVPYDFDIQSYTDKNLNKDKIVASHQFVEKLNKIKAKRLLVILDCCHSGGMTNTRDLEIENNNFLDKIQKELSPQGLIEVVEESNNTRNLNKVQPSTGRVILTSCKAEEKALDVSVNNKNGLFTEALLEVLGGQDNFEKDGYVDIWDIQRYLTKVVPRRALELEAHLQHPVVASIENLEGRFIVCAYDRTRSLQSSGQATPSQTNNQITHNDNNMDEIKRKVGEFVSKNRIKDCLNYLGQQLPSDGLIKELKGQFEENERGNSRGILSRDSYNIEHRRIVAKIMDNYG